MAVEPSTHKSFDINFWEDNVLNELQNTGKTL